MSAVYGACGALSRSRGAPADFREIGDDFAFRVLLVGSSSSIQKEVWGLILEGWPNINGYAAVFNKVEQGKVDVG